MLTVAGVLGVSVAYAATPNGDVDQAANPLLGKYFDQIDAHRRGYLTREGIRAAMLKKMESAVDQ
ncbi:hypothetical protein WT01_36425 [Burkholderia cepacia]|nr:hypothetical protein WT01_36425 [Burkholderia cepacia]